MIQFLLQAFFGTCPLEIQDILKSIFMVNSSFNLVPKRTWKAKCKLVSNWDFGLKLTLT